VSNVCQEKPALHADHSSRGVLSDVVYVCVCVIVKPR
jgi:hypothetical protein